MWKQIKCLSGISLCNTLGLNEARFGRDSKKRQRVILLGCTFLFLGLMLLFYTGLLSYAYVRIGLLHMIPAYLLAVTSLIILFFSLFKAGNVIFDRDLYEKQIVLPVRPSAIIFSRFLTMYLFNAVLALLVMIPGAAVYAWAAKPAISFYFMMAFGIFLLPLLPMTVATALGALVLAVSSRVKHKNLVNILLSAVLTIGAVVLSVVLSFQSEQVSQRDLTNLSAIIYDKIGKSYPPALLFSAGVVDGNWGDFLLFAVSSLLVFLLFLLLVQWKYVEICTALSSHAAGGNYVMRQLVQNSPLKAFYQKELRRYFASSIYVLNTGMGYILMVVFSIAVLAVGVDKIEDMMQMKGLIGRMAPLLLSSLCIITSTTSSAISMEGRQWWIVKSLPVTTETVLDAKILVNLTIALPCYLISVCLLCLAVPADLAGDLWMILLPFLYILFSSVLGITVNLKMPVFNWESEVAVVKQSGATLVCMLFGFLSVVFPFVFLFLLPSGCKNLVYLGTSVVIVLITAVLYRKNNRILLKNID